jgi:signal transduction histidine kinase
MIPKSIKWRLQLWYGLILVAVLVGFGVTAYQLERNRVFRRVDDDLHRRANAVAQSLHRPPRGRPPDAPDQRGFPPPEPFDRENAPGPDGPPTFNLAPPIAALFDTNDASGFYFLIRSLRPGHAEIARSANAPKDAGTQFPEPPARPQDAETGPPPGDISGDDRGSARGEIPGEPPQPVMRGSCRELMLLTPLGESVLVGKNVSPELTELRRSALNLSAIGGVILFIGLAGGRVLVGRALRPISDISHTAAKIAAGDLSQRINSAGTGSELGQLAAVLNATFARLETAFAQQKQFASDAAHELRTPVSVILTQTQTALTRERDAASYRQTVEACQRAAQRMRKLIESLLELARFDAGQEALKRLDFDLSATVADCVELVQPLAEERRVKISAELKPLRITGDSERLAQVVTNLLTNAIQFNRPDGEARVKLEAREGLAVLEISDTGQGIAPDDLPHVFERFYRADKSRTGAGNSGLGLAICKAIVEAHSGVIEVSSGEKAGTTFTVRLPLAI